MLGLDTSPFIYHLETHPRYGPAAATLFEWLEERGSSAVTSTVTMTELLVHPSRTDDVDRVNRIYAFASTYPNLGWLPTTLDIADEAARLRAKYGLRTPDAIQVATALSAGATGFVGNDRGFTRVADLEILLLDHVVARDLAPTTTKQAPDGDRGD